MEKLTLRDIHVKNKRVLMRVDFNVPLLEGGEISDDSRIRAALPSIRYVLEGGGSLVLMSHLGRPDGKVEEKYSLAPCAKRLGELLGRVVKMAPDCVGGEVEKIVKGMKVGDVLLLENLRFHIGEEHPEKERGFVEELAKLGDVYVNDAFGTAHRAHASTALIASFFQGKAAEGFLMEKEVTILGNLLENPKRPFYAIVGGAKVSTKAGVIRNLLSRLDGLFIGGGMAYTFLKAQGMKIGNSLCDEKEKIVAAEILEEAALKNIPCWLPIDLVIADKFEKEAKKKVVSVKEGITDGWQGMGIGPETVEMWSKELKMAATIFWNGPLSVFEMPRFAEGTFEIAKRLAHSPATVIVGGGDSIAAIEQQGLGEQFAHLSTGGGAALEFLEFGRLPGIDALSNK
jgi:phosphoglycerate kinase